MASGGDEACAIANEPKMDPSTSSDTVQSINGSFPKIDNLEYFPEKVLHQIFSKLNDTGLLNVATTSYRFEGIAKIVFKEKYASKYFVFDNDTDSAREMYEELFSRFGRHADIKAIKAKGIRNIDSENHWLPKLLRQYTNELQKLAIEECTFVNVINFLQQHMNITHLSVRNVSLPKFLPDYRNLIKLELIYCGREIISLTQTVRQNPSLESLILWDSGRFNVSEMLTVIAEHRMHLKELKLDAWTSAAIPAEVMDALVESLKQLESFGFRMSHVGNDHLELVRRLSLKCKNLKQLELVCLVLSENITDEIFEAIRRFQTLESLTISQSRYDGRIESLVEILPILRHLRLSMDIPSPDTSILSLLRKCPSLETISIGYYYSSVRKYFLNSIFFDELKAVMQQPHGKVELEEYGQKNFWGFVTKKEIVWQNMSLHWTECDPSYNLSGVNLLDLAKPLEASGAERRNPFDHVLDYLDVRSLASLSIASKCSNQLVQGYVQRHAQRNGTFTITDYFRCDSRGLGAFAEHIRNLKVHFSRLESTGSLRMIRNRYQNLIKLWISTNSCRRANSYEFPQVREMILNVPIESFNPYFDFYEFSRLNPDLESLELKRVVGFRGLYDMHGVLQFRDLKRLVFKYKDKNDRNYAKFMFRNTTTELIPMEEN